MVRNEELSPIGGSAKIVAEYVKARAESKNVSIASLAAALGKARSYASIRYNGLKTWNMDDLDAIAPLLGFDSGLELIFRAGGR